MPSQPPLRCGGFLFDCEARRLLGADGAEAALTAMEFDLLRILTERPNRVLRRDQLLDLAHGKGAEPRDRRITRLRRKLRDNLADPRLIRTIRGTGYRFSVD